MDDEHALLICSANIKFQTVSQSSALDVNLAVPGEVVILTQVLVP